MRQAATKRQLRPPKHLLYPRKREDEGARHVRATEVAASRHEGRHSSREKRRALQDVGSNAGVLGENDPALLPRFAEPHDVGSVLIAEVLIVDDDALVLAPKRSGDEL
jgi:hypothetical protein